MRVFIVVPLLALAGCSSVPQGRQRGRRPGYLAESGGSREVLADETVVLEYEGNLRYSSSDSLHSGSRNGGVCTGEIRRTC